MNRNDAPCALTKARDWFEARLRGRRLPEHEMQDDWCPFCAEPPCAQCIEYELEAKSHERSC